MSPDCQAAGLGKPESVLNAEACQRQVPVLLPMPAVQQLGKDCKAYSQVWAIGRQHQLEFSGSEVGDEMTRLACSPAALSKNMLHGAVHALAIADMLCVLSSWHLFRENLRKCLLIYIHSLY